MNVSVVKIGSRLELELASNLGDKSYTYVSQLLDIVDDKNIVLAAPIQSSRVIFIPAGARLKAIFLHEIHGLLSIPCTVVSKGQKGSVAVLNARIDGEFEKIQRRKYFRLACYLKVLYHICENYDENTGFLTVDEKDCKKALTRNLSGSGVCIATEEDIPPGSVIYISILINNEIKANAVCKVMRCTRIESSEGEKFEVGLHYIKISKNSQDAIIKYIFDQQRLLLKKDIR